MLQISFVLAFVKILWQDYIRSRCCRC